MHQHLGEFIQEHREDILALWLEQVSALPSAADKPVGVLRDHVPQILDRIAAELVGNDAMATMEDLAGKHAILRYREGYNLRQVFLEYQALRFTIQTLYSERAPQESASLRKLTTFDRFLDDAIGTAVEQYTEEHDRVRDVFVATLGHDLRAPLQAILSTAALLSRGGGDPVRSAALVTRSALRMDRLIGDLLDFARARLGGGIPLVLAEHDLRPILEAVVQEIASTHPARDLTCPTDGAPIDLRGEWDGDRLAQAVSNLVSNAVDHGADPIVVRAIDDGVDVVVEVHNRGSIAEEARTALFKPFHAGARSQGLGLGLYVVHEIARAHGGRVEADTRDGGTTFRLVLPRRRV